MEGDLSYDDIAFTFWLCHEDGHLAPRLVWQIREAGFSGQIVAISDGSLKSNVLSDLGVDLRINPLQIKQDDIVGILRRNYSQLLDASEAKGFIHVDPDTEVHRLPPLPKSDWAGSIMQFWRDQTLILSTWGCGFYTSRQIVELLATSQVKGIFYEEPDGTRMGSRDFTMGLVLNREGVFPTEWIDTEVSSVSAWKANVLHLSRKYEELMSSGRWAITHPCRNKANST